MSFLLLFFSVVLETMKNVFTNYFGKNIFVTSRDTLLFNVVSGIGACVFFAFSANVLITSSFSIIAALVFSLFTAMANYFTLMAFAVGNMAGTTLLMYIGGMIIPAMFGCFFYNQTPSVYQITGCVLMIVSLVLCIDLKKDKSMGLKWFLYSVGSFLSWGLVGVCQQVHQNSKYAFEIDEFLFWTFVFVTILFALMKLLVKNKDNKENGYRVRSKHSIMVLLVGVFIALIYKINLYLAGVMDGVVFFPIVNGGVLLLSSLCAMVFFREKLNTKQKIGMLIGVASVCILGI